MADLVESSDESLPSAQECDSRCKHFSQVTTANSIEAQMYLQQHDWNLERAIQAYFDAESTGSSASGKTDLPAAQSKSDITTKLSMNPNELTLLTWNLDGLDTVSLITRTRSAIAVIKEEDPDIVFLQEVVAQSWNVIQQELRTHYETLPACKHSQYYTAVLLKKGSVLLDNYEVKPFHSSMMMRRLQIVHINVKGMDFKLLNTHLESTAAHSVERIRQFKLCIEELASSTRELNVIFAGDLNLGAKDLNGLTLPNDVVDMWEATGSKPEKKYTWDMKYNDNKVMSRGGTPRCRFDRVFFRSAENKQVSPSEFHLRGMERAKDCSRFPSDHWALLVKFNIKTE